MTLTKSDLIDKIYNQCEVEKAKSTDIVEHTLRIIKDTLASEEDVLITGFGKFCIKEKSERRGRNPQTGEDFLLSPRRVVTFKCSTVFKERINGGE
jgi:integration host factor subunit alpha